MIDVRFRETHLANFRKSKIKFQNNVFDPICLPLVKFKPKSRIMAIKLRIVIKELLRLLIISGWL